ncbi:MAG: hypothetical protein ACE5JP_13615 [Candidatus Bipolaricaulia bacterium]
MMRSIWAPLTVAVLVLTVVMTLFSTTSWAHKGVTELAEGTLVELFFKESSTGTKGYAIYDFSVGQIRVEVKDLPRAEVGYEAFLVEVDVPTLANAVFVDGDPDKGIRPDFDLTYEQAVGAVVKSVQSIGSFNTDARGNGTLVFNEGRNLHSIGYSKFNMLIIFEQNTPGVHEAPEGRVVLECHGTLEGAPGPAVPIRDIAPSMG